MFLTQSRNDNPRQLIRNRQFECSLASIVFGINGSGVFQDRNDSSNFAKMVIACHRFPAGASESKQISSSNDVSVSYGLLIFSCQSKVQRSAVPALSPVRIDSTSFAINKQRNKLVCITQTMPQVLRFQPLDVINSGLRAFKSHSASHSFSSS